MFSPPGFSFLAWTVLILPIESRVMSPKGPYDPDLEAELETLCSGVHFHAFGVEPLGFWLVGPCPMSKQLQQSLPGQALPDLGTASLRPLQRRALRPGLSAAPARRLSGQLRGHALAVTRCSCRSSRLRRCPPPGVQVLTSLLLING